jgi:lipoate-protein ligase A
VLHGAKIVGSAQRRRSGAVLQHGSLLLGRSTLVPELPGLIDLAAIDASVESWSCLLRAAIPAALGCVLENCAFIDLEPGRLLAREEHVYRNPAWTQRR